MLVRYKSNRIVVIERGARINSLDFSQMRKFAKSELASVRKAFAFAPAYFSGRAYMPMVQCFIQLVLSRSRVLG